ncbi:SERTA domain-containing protein 4 [Erinaceus europaeus]|uniref:SERTA domain-containing protein 4 n=1 Tax=Erinaceus europaeus TaxID=9365 RepID=A0ABM3WCR0_ERIEU|nr:SERTA domain-containing protein 4 [Erinaceus europaeus]
MTLVLSMNRFSEPIVSGEACYQTLWAPGPTQVPLQGDRGAGPPPAASCYGGTSSPVAAPKPRSFKRKRVEEEDLGPAPSSCSQKTVSVFEERARVLYMSLEKLRLIEDPEVYLHRCVLINNVLRRVHGEILAQSSWRLPAAHQWLLARDCPFRKRPRLAGEDGPRPPTCCLSRELGDPRLGVTLPLGAPAAPLPELGCPRRADAVPLGTGDDQMPASDIFGIREKARHCLAAGDGGPPSLEAGGAELAFACGGQFCDHFETGHGEKMPMGGPGGSAPARQSFHHCRRRAPDCAAAETGECEPSQVDPTVSSVASRPV